MKKLLLTGLSIFLAAALSGCSLEALDKMTDDAINAIGTTVSDAMEDVDVREILGSYKTQLEEIHADTAILDELWDYYTDEKTAEKAYYLDKYLN